MQAGRCGKTVFRISCSASSWDGGETKERVLFSIDEVWEVACNIYYHYFPTRFCFGWCGCIGKKEWGQIDDDSYCPHA